MKGKPRRRVSALDALLNLERFLEDNGFAGVLPKKKPPDDKPKPAHPRQLQAIKQGREKRQAEIKKYGSKVTVRRFRRMLAERFEEFLPPCQKCLVCRRRMENGLGGFGKFCNDCLATERDELYRARKDWEAMRKYFNLKPHQRLTKRLKDQYLMDTIYGKTPSPQEIYYGSDNQEATRS